MALQRVLPHFMRDLERSFERAFEDPFFRAANPARLAMLNRPFADLTETRESFVIEAELPGLAKDDVQLEFSNGNTLTLKGSVVAKEPAEGSTLWNQERMFGTFQRSFSLPSSIDSEKVRAELKDGILTVTVPKSEEKINKIEIQ